MIYCVISLLVPCAVLSFQWTKDFPDSYNILEWPPYYTVFIQTGVVVSGLCESRTNRLLGCGHKHIIIKN